MSHFYLNIQNQNIWIQTISLSSNDNAPTIVFLHEGLGSVAQWKDYPEKVCSALGMNGVIFDRQGHGQSSALEVERGKDYLHVEALEFLAPLLEQLEIQNPILYGHSDGGTIALIYAAYFPKKVQAIITEAAHIKVEEITLEGIKSTVKQYRTSNLPKKLQKYHGAKTDDLFRAWSEIWLSEAFQDWSIGKLLPQIQCPVLLLQGKEDTYATEGHLWEIEAKIGGRAKGVLLEDCGHAPHKKKAKQIISLLIDFWESSKDKV